MAVIQISKIILRKGPQQDLPGAPTSLTPLTFSQGLDAGEMAFAEDTGRLFIGHQPDEGHPNFKRATFPYQNVEVLTELSKDAVEGLVGTYEKTGSSRSFNEASLAPSSAWNSVVVPRVGDPNYAYRLEYGASVSALITYSVFDANQKPIRQGTMSLQYFDGEAEPLLIDNAQISRRLDLVASDNFNPATVFNLVEFRFLVTGPVGSEHLAFQYKNRDGGVLYLRFKVTLPEV